MCVSGLILCHQYQLVIRYQHEITAINSLVRKTKNKPKKQNKKNRRRKQRTEGEFYGQLFCVHLSTCCCPNSQTPVRFCGVCFFRLFSDVSRTLPSKSRDGIELQFQQPGRPSGRDNQLPFGPVGREPTGDDVIAIDTTGRGRTAPVRDAGTRRRMPLRCPTAISLQNRKKQTDENIEINTKSITSHYPN